MELAGLRLLHLVFGFLWAGGAVILGFFVAPSVNEAGPGGAAVMAGIVQKRKLLQVMNVSAVITGVCGLRLYMLKFSTAWLTTPEGIVLSLGGLLAVGGFFIGVMAVGPTSRKILALGQAINDAGGPPSDGQAQELGALKAKMGRLSMVMAVHLLAATVLMSAMRMAQVLGT